MEPRARPSLGPRAALRHAGTHHPEQTWTFPMHGAKGAAGVSLFQLSCVSSHPACPHCHSATVPALGLGTSPGAGGHKTPVRGW